jgi:hypothetical protein
MEEKLLEDVLAKIKAKAIFLVKFETPEVFKTLEPEQEHMD